MPDNTNRIKEDLKRRAGEFLTNKLGYSTGVINDLLVVDCTDYGEYEYRAIVSADVKFSDLENLANYLNPIIHRYDEFAYFEPTDSCELSVIISHD